MRYIRSCTTQDDEQNVAGYTFSDIVDQNRFSMSFSFLIPSLSVQHCVLANNMSINNAESMSILSG